MFSCCCLVDELVQALCDGKSFAEQCTGEQDVESMGFYLMSMYFEF